MVHFIAVLLVSALGADLNGISHDPSEEISEKIGLEYQLLSDGSIPTPQHKRVDTFHQKTTIQKRPSYPPVKDLSKSTCSSPEDVSLGFVGDLLMHGPVQEKGYRLRDFKSLWPKWLPLFRSLDILYGNLELPVAPGISKAMTFQKDPGPIFDNFVYSGYPLFNIHPIFLDHLAESGFKVLSTANNHALDRGTIGVERTIDHLINSRISFIGTRYRNAPWEPFTITRAKSVQIAWVACTSILNIPDRDHVVAHCDRDRLQLLALIAELSKKYEAVIVTPHWGQENQDLPTAEQLHLAHQFIEAGALAVVGAHPHVLQPIERVITDKRQRLIAYSLGNFIANNPRLKQKASMVLMICLSTKGSKVSIAEGRVIPAYIRNRTGNVMDIENMPIDEDVLNRDPWAREVYDHILTILGKTMNF
ncbi:MAG: CapA family protein [Bdellovibrionaceae bacterium]|nr:CapA family protein [Pseudobdellovibrionaceae bacterium]MDW8191040.1 CapA family protein [Pseudobdellovibrionaceae bacterium]